MKAFLCISVITLRLCDDFSFAKGNASTETESLRDAQNLFYFLTLISRVVEL